LPDGRGSGGALRRLAPAKVNLALHVTGARPDGYHTLDTLVAFAGFGDAVSVAPADALGLSVGGALADHAPSGPDNLAWRAAALLQATAGAARGAHIHIDKTIPAGAGLGGGSADAAAALLALNDLWQTGLDRDSLAQVALRLGADVPMCLQAKALRARGIGEAINLLPALPPVPLVLVWPGLALGTGQVFATLATRENPPLPDPPARFDGAPELAEWLAACRNDLEAPAIRLAPVVADVIQEIETAAGCLLARMTGAGSACFGVFATSGEAEAAAAAIAAARPAWWVRATVAG
jgi:4-diphosphocytidyl-2-C-methyl-D-erythritol kinase